MIISPTERRLLINMPINLTADDFEGQFDDVLPRRNSFSLKKRQHSIFKADRLGLHVHNAIRIG